MVGSTVLSFLRPSIPTLVDNPTLVLKIVSGHRAWARHINGVFFPSGASIFEKRGKTHAYVRIQASRKKPMDALLLD